LPRVQVHLPASSPGCAVGGWRPGLADLSLGATGTPTGVLHRRRRPHRGSGDGAPVPGEGCARTAVAGAGQRSDRLHLAMKSHKEDRKSTRLNSSHVAISYAVFCLKKKTTPESWRRALTEIAPGRLDIALEAER